ncbi:hypothetical protein QLQ85_08890 [Halomonas sp. M4R5S39]|uniref:hypothetical protein n=1 Tax=Halomonas kalidii TaxID=3043293 RepID=UPI0024A9C530|nr:hypothetical protein [Halomonas kalidii]MDI5984906.1 hypothetical protein [Halomonas kalidii]
MTNRELADRRRQLADKAQTIAGLHPMMAAGEIKVAAMLMAEITDELTRRELARQEAPA